MKINYFECNCSSGEHLIRFSYFPEDPDIMYLEVHLVKHTFVDRLVSAVKYLFGHGSNYGHFDEFLLDRNMATKMRSAITDFLDNNDA